MFMAFGFWQQGNSVIRAMLKNGNSDVMDGLGRERVLAELLGMPNLHTGGLKKSSKVGGMELWDGSAQKPQIW